MNINDITVAYTNVFVTVCVWMQWCNNFNEKGSTFTRNTQPHTHTQTETGGTTHSVLNGSCTRKFWKKNHHFCCVFVNLLYGLWFLICNLTRYREKERDRDRGHYKSHINILFAQTIFLIAMTPFQAQNKSI